MRQMLKLMAVAMMMAAPWVNAAEGNDAIKERIKPVGQVCVEGDACASESVAAVATPSATEARSGESIFNSKCMACHMTGAAGAPIKGNKDQWAPRIAQGMDTLMSHALNGLNAMPAKGTCMDCSEDEIKATVEFMVNASQ